MTHPISGQGSTPAKQPLARRSKFSPIRLVPAFLILAGWLASPLSATAQPPEEPTPDPWIEERAAVSLQGWQSKGTGDWSISFSGTDDFGGGPVPLTGKSRLTFDNLKSTIPVVAARVRATPWLRFSGSYGSGDVSGGTTTDGDWLTIPAYGLKDYYFSESKSDASGTVTAYDINVLFRIYPWLGRESRRLEPDERRRMRPPESAVGGPPREKGVTIDLLAGFQSYQDDLTMTNGVQTVENERAVREPFYGLNSKYAFDWSALRAGIAGMIPIGRRLEVRASYAYIFNAEYRGEAFWNLRTDFRSTPPNFVHDADGGTGSELKISLAYHPTRLVFVEGGFWSIKLEAKNGIDTVYLADGSALSSKLDKVTSKREGAFAGIGVKF
ncbi:MAG: hypothetical protein A2V83_01390 [Nitrospirae bacterium RBG_16_64_22]|nr:MAG: hypothetical protein A2V83_01390 [Nitrospirae bacterium RBG_16_64_22]